MRRFYNSSWSLIAMLGIVANFSIPTVLHAQATATSSPQAAFSVVKAYLRAIRARDYETAYGHISARDQSVGDKPSYLRSQESFNGFALELAKQLAAAMDIWVIEQRLGSTKGRLETGYRELAADEIFSQLHDWDQDKLNSLSRAEQITLLESLNKLKTTRTRLTLEGRETFDLVLEKTGWKIFLGWPSQRRVQFKTAQSRSDQIAVSFLRNDLFIKNEEPFQVDFKITNRTSRPLVVKLNHLFAPRRMEKSIDMIACGSLVPFSLRPQETQALSSAYILRGDVSDRTALEIIYDFSVLAAPEKRRLSQLTIKASQ